MSLIASIEARLKLYEEEITKSLANHNALVGAMQELKNILAMAAPIAEALAPAASPVIEEVKTVVDAVDNAVQPQDCLGTTGCTAASA